MEKINYKDLYLCNNSKLHIIQKRKRKIFEKGKVL